MDVDTPEFSSPEGTLSAAQDDSPGLFRDNFTKPRQGEIRLRQFIVGSN